MGTILTSDQFVAGIIAALCIRERMHFVLSDTEIDRQFENAYEDLLKQEEALGIVPNFSFYRDASHGDSARLRDTLLAARDKKIISLNNPTFKTFDIKISKERAEKYLEKNPVPRSFYETIAERIFST